MSHQKSLTKELNLLSYVKRYIHFSQKTFGPGPRTSGILEHIRKELKEIEAAPSDLGEWIDVLRLALEGAWRSGHTAEQIVEAILFIQAKNENRNWPDWQTADRSKAIEHIRDTSMYFNRR